MQRRSPVANAGYICRRKCNEKSLLPIAGGRNKFYSILTESRRHQSRGYKGPGMFLCRGARLREAMEIPVFHDARHRTAIISVAALPNALELQGKTIEPVKVVFSGAGAGRYASNPTRRTRHTNSTPPNRKRRFIFLDPLACPPLRN